MPYGRLLSISAGAATIAASLLACALPASSEPTGEGPARYLPSQSIRYAFGSKVMSGYFVRQVDACFVTLMLAEKDDPAVPPRSATRLRLVLQSGQVAGLDSAEGRSLNLACAEEGRALLVEVGARERLETLQWLAFSRDLAGWRDGRKPAGESPPSSRT